MTGWRAGGFLPPLSTCRTVFIDYGLHRFKLAIQAPEGRQGPETLEAVQPLADPKTGLVELVEDPNRRTGRASRSRARSSSSSVR